MRQTKYALWLLVSILLMTGILMSCSDQDVVGDSGAYHAMLDTTSSWIYSLHKIDAAEHEYSWCHEWWEVHGTDTIKGKVYYKLERYYSPINGGTRSEADNLDERWFVMGPMGHVISLREESGRIYALKSQYVDFLKSLSPETDDFFLAPASDDDEVLLYDFTLQEDDFYPCSGDKVRVTSVTWKKTPDGLHRKVLVLSNGFKIVEGVGLIGSCGGLIAYQNVQLLTRRRDYISYLFGSVQNGLSTYFE